MSAVSCIYLIPELAKSLTEEAFVWKRRHRRLGFGECQQQLLTQCFEFRVSVRVSISGYTPFCVICKVLTSSELSVSHPATQQDQYIIQRMAGIVNPLTEELSETGN